ALVAGSADGEGGKGPRNALGRCRPPHAALPGAGRRQGDGGCSCACFSSWRKRRCPSGCNSPLRARSSAAHRASAEICPPQRRDLSHGRRRGVCVRTCPPRDGRRPRYQTLRLALCLDASLTKGLRRSDAKIFNQTEDEGRKTPSDDAGPAVRYAPLLMPLFPTTIAGSLPKPAWLAQPEVLWPAFADLLNAEARALASDGVDLIQFDEPAFNVYMREVSEWGIEALHRAAAGLTCTTAVHICYGYGIKANIDWKATLGPQWRQYEEIFPAL